MRSPVVWFGGKSRLSARLNSLVPEHKTYVEAFGGGASLLFRKSPSAVEVYNDIDENIVNFFRVLRSPRATALLQAKLNKTPYSRVEYQRFCKTLGRKLSDVERAYQWFCVMRMSFGSQFGKSWGVSLHGSNGGVASCIHRFHSSTDLLELACTRLRNVVVECQDWRKLCRRYDGKMTLLFLDPPYLPSTRKDGKYKHELTEEDHIELVKFLSNCRSKVILCGYDNPIYYRLLHKGWRQIKWPHRCCLNNRQGCDNAGQRRVENVWLNYKPR